MDINIVNIDEINLKHIDFSKSISINKDQRKISIGYNSNIDFHIQTPLLTSNMNYAHSYNNMCRIRFDPMLGQILKFYKFIINLENLINDHILKHNIDYRLCTILKNDNVDLFDNSPDDYLKYILLSINNTKIFNNMNELTTIRDLKYGYKFKSLVKIDSIWINCINKKFGLNIELIQIKIVKPLYMSTCLIDHTQSQSQSQSQSQLQSQLQLQLDKQSQSHTQTQLTIPTHIPQYLPTTTNNIIVQNNQPIIIDKIIFRPPDPSQLLQLKKSLKKVID